MTDTKLINQEWATEYVKNFQAEVVKFLDKFEEEEGFRPQILVDYEISLKISGKYKHGPNILNLWSMNINPTNALKAKKPHLAVKRFAKSISWRRNADKHIPDMYSRLLAATPDDGLDYWYKNNPNYLNSLKAKPNIFHPATWLEKLTSPTNAKKLDRYLALKDNP